MQQSRQLSLSSFPLQLSLQLSMAVSVLWFLAAVATLAYKGITLPYREDQLAMEIVMMVLVLVVEFGSRSLASRGNLLEYRGPLLTAVFISFYPVGFLAYCIRWQPYVLYLDLVMGSIFLAIKGITILLTLSQFMSLSFVSQTL
eukprot:TRINITY_DN36756_c0_g1_i1.p1 TRINITY_DN36756_c0_g1~~TRINITY_DN36756_c0_g1_i1.p1  ORF type:complete len:144 (+),score=20.27 TRINITY_DN36756_c0_g1_i1:43-474(+)